MHALRLDALAELLRHHVDLALSRVALVQQLGDGGVDLRLHLLPVVDAAVGVLPELVHFARLALADVGDALVVVVVAVAALVLDAAVAERHLADGAEPLGELEAVPGAHQLLARRRRCHRLHARLRHQRLHLVIW